MPDRSEPPVGQVASQPPSGKAAPLPPLSRPLPPTVDKSSQRVPAQPIETAATDPMPETRPIASEPRPADSHSRAPLWIGVAVALAVLIVTATQLFDWMAAGPRERAAQKSSASLIPGSSLLLALSLPQVALSNQRRIVLRMRMFRRPRSLIPHQRSRRLRYKKLQNQRPIRSHRNHCALRLQRRRRKRVASRLCRRRPEKSQRRSLRLTRPSPCTRWRKQRTRRFQNRRRLPPQRRRKSLPQHRAPQPGRPKRRPQVTRRVLRQRAHRRQGPHRTHRRRASSPRLRNAFTNRMKSRRHHDCSSRSNRFTRRRRAMPECKAVFDSKPKSGPTAVRTTFAWCRASGTLTWTATPWPPLRDGNFLQAATVALPLKCGR